MILVNADRYTQCTGNAGTNILVTIACNEVMVVIIIPQVMLVMLVMYI